MRSPRPRTTTLDRALDALKVIDRCIDHEHRPDDSMFLMLAQAMDQHYGPLPDIRHTRSSS